jgi:deoxyribose-phosphate aldolase
MPSLSSIELAARLDATLWNPVATAGDIEAFCAEAHDHKLRAVCVNGSRVELACVRLEDSGVQVVALVSFPLGTADADVKRYEVEAAVDHGAQEIELPLNCGLLKDGAHKALLRELRDVVEAADQRPVCVTLETALLTREEINLACELIVEAGAQGVSSSTDFRPEARVSADDVKALREAVGPKFIVKAAGGISDPQTASILLDAGASRLGSSDVCALWRQLIEE